MSQLDTILEYQTIDIQRRRKLNEIENSDYAKKAHKSRGEFDKARQTLAEAEDLATPIVNYFARANEICAKAVRDFEELQKTIDGIDDLTLLESTLNGLNTYRSKIIEAERKLTNHAANGKDIIENYKIAQEKGKSAKDSYTSNLKNLEQMRATNKIVLENFEKQLRDLRSAGDKNHFLAYDELAKEKKIPAFVPLANSDTCSGCGMQMSQKTLASLKEQGATCRCDTCSRVVYKNQK